MPRLYTSIGAMFCVIVASSFVQPSVNARPDARDSNQQVDCNSLQALPPSAADGGELSNSDKTIAFADVFANGTTYQDYGFALDTSVTPPGTILPVIAKSVAGIESGWQQYKPDGDGNLFTLRGDINPNDFGIMQINSGCPTGPVEAVFSRNPSLLTNTRGNIAAGAEILKDKWNSGATAGEVNPIVNDQDPEQLLNWYYAISSYNKAPSAPTPTAPNGLWRNNPTCNGSYTYCEGEDYRQSRPWETDIAQKDVTVDWLTNDDRSSYPYQELVLYNLQFPRYPLNSLWSVQDLGLKQIISRGNYGIRPDDALFRSSTGISRARNLLLFKHRGREVFSGLSQQIFFVDYELPLGATVTIELLSNAVNGTVLATLLPGTPRDAGWHNERFVLTQPVESGYAYRIRATRGDPAVTATYFEGQYVQNLAVEPLGSGGSGSQTFLPFIGTGTPAAPDPVRDGNLLISTTTYLPVNWNLQSIYGPGINAATQARLDKVPGKAANQLRIAAAPGGRVELTQRVHLPVETDYCLGYTLGIEGTTGDAGTTFTARSRSLNGTTWSPQTRSDELDPTQPDEKTVEVFVPADQDQVISFLAIFGPADTNTVFKLTQIHLDKGKCETSGPSVAP